MLTYPLMVSHVYCLYEIEKTMDTTNNDTELNQLKRTLIDNVDSINIKDAKAAQLWLGFLEYSDRMVLTRFEKVENVAGEMSGWPLDLAMLRTESNASNGKTELEASALQTGTGAVYLLENGLIYRESPQRSVEERLSDAKESMVRLLEEKRTEK